MMPTRNRNWNLHITEKIPRFTNYREKLPGKSQEDAYCNKKKSDYLKVYPTYNLNCDFSQ